MNKNLILKHIVLASSLMTTAHLSHATEFKRFSVSAGWLHVMPQGDANPFNINTAVNPNKKYGVGDISQSAFLGAIAPNAEMPDGAPGGGMMPAKPFLEQVFDGGLAPLLGILVDNNDPTSAIAGASSGDTYVRGIDHWTQTGTGLEADDADTLGLMFNYYVNDNVSLQLIGGIPPKVDIKGKGEIIAPMTGIAYPQGAIESLFPNGLDLAKNIPITNLGNKSKAATVRAWTPAFEAQYQFGKSGVNKFRPYIGAGIMYAHFNNIKLNSEIKSDLIAAGHMIQNILDNNAGAALDGKTSSANPYVKVKTEDAFAPIISLGATYDINNNWFGVASVSYSKMNNKTKIDVIDSKTGNQLIHATTKVDIDPLITYVGVGYRF
ncbi:OmpW family outer membrane protein [Acinetobacter sp.]|uniref:OmpW/AlkL family protein n=1 Tax=Acinetobacter sp. TaxID=472 RepID=UPI003340C9DE